jgi:hypothetical protein
MPTFACHHQGVLEQGEPKHLLHHPNAIVARASSLLCSDKWAELATGVVVCSGRRLAEVLKIGIFTVKGNYSVWFQGQVEGHDRIEERFEIPTLVQAYLVVDAVLRVRQLVDCSALTVDDVGTTKGLVVDEAVARCMASLLPRETVTVHLLRMIYASIATFWFAPPDVADYTYLTHILGYRCQAGKRGETAVTDGGKALDWSPAFNSGRQASDDAVIETVDTSNGRQGILPVSLAATEVSFSGLAPFQEKAGEQNETCHQGAKESNEQKKGNREEVLLEVRGQSGGNEHGESLLLCLFSGEASMEGNEWSTVTDGVPSRSASGLPEHALDRLPITQEARDLLYQGMRLSSASGLLSYLVVAGERRARQLISQAKRHEGEQYASMRTSQLATIKVPEASQERCRRAVYTIMQWNATHSPLERWYITTLAIQNLVGGRKDAIKTYQEAVCEEIEAHHREWQIKPSFNRRKSVAIEKMITIPEEPTAFPWGREPEEG